MDPYQAGIIPDDIYHARRMVTGEIVAVMARHLEGRHLELIPQPTRAFRKYELVELIVTDETPIQKNIINSIAYLGFFEVKQGGVIKKADKLKVNGKIIGSVIGYDETHMPNHLNLLIKMDVKRTGVEMNLNVNDAIEFQ